MPYIKRDRRELVARQGPVTEGDLNYILTSICVDYMPTDFTYNDLNEVVGALELCKQEFIRRMVNPYEDKKIIENGDVYHGIEGKRAPSNTTS